MLKSQNLLLMQTKKQMKNYAVYATEKKKTQKKIQ